MARVATIRSGTPDCGRIYVKWAGSFYMPSSWDFYILKPRLACNSPRLCRRNYRVLLRSWRVKIELTSGNWLEAIDEVFESFVRPKIVEHRFNPYPNQPRVSAFEGFIQVFDGAIVFLQTSIHNCEVEAGDVATLRECQQLL